MSFPRCGSLGKYTLYLIGSRYKVGFFCLFHGEPLLIGLYLLVSSFDFVFLYPGHLQEIVPVVSCCVPVKGVKVTPEPPLVVSSGLLLVMLQSTAGRRTATQWPFEFPPRQHTAVRSVDHVLPLTGLQVKRGTWAWQ